MNFLFHPIRRLYDWVLAWADSRYAVAALVIVAFAEASFFPVPPDVLLIAMALAAPARGFAFATWCTAASVAGGVLGYGIGVGLMDAIGCGIVHFYHGERTFNWLANTFIEYDFWAIFIAAVTPIPYKIFTITAGATGANFGTFLLASVLGRPIRFFAIALLIWFVGPPVKRFIDRYFNVLSVVFVVLLVGGFAAFGLLGHEEDPARRTPSHYARICS